MGWLVLALTPAAFGQGVIFRQSGFDAGAQSWTVWSARAETAPRAYIDLTHSRGKAGALALSGASNPAAHGGWHRKAEAVRPGKWHRLTAYYRAEAVPFEHRQILARLEWLNAAGKRAGQPDYGWKTAREGEWRRVTLEAPAPEDARSVVVQLYLSNAPQGTVWWDEVSLEEMTDPGERRVTVAAVNLQPSNTGSAQESVRQFLELVERAAPADADVILLPEGITVVGTGRKYADVAEAVPGPTTSRLAEVARRRKAWIAAGIYEREGGVIYNTAVLLDREGKLAGKYRKVYLPREEVEGGITPGDYYPVFRTDFGTIGMMICYDVFFADPARALAVAGAEMILMPIWGGDETLAKARAIENKVFLIASGYNHPTYIMDPDGERLAQAERGNVAVAKVDLNRRYMQSWLGDMHARRLKELRTDVRVEPGPR
jgi:predicted amidohydrolase